MTPAFLQAWIASIAAFNAMVAIKLLHTHGPILGWFLSYIHASSPMGIGALCGQWLLSLGCYLLACLLLCHNAWAVVMRVYVDQQ